MLKFLILIFSFFTVGIFTYSLENEFKVNYTIDNQNFSLENAIFAKELPDIKEKTTKAFFQDISNGEACEVVIPQKHKLNLENLNELILDYLKGNSSSKVNTKMNYSIDFDNPKLIGNIINNCDGIFSYKLDEGKLVQGSDKFSFIYNNSYYNLKKGTEDNQKVNNKTELWAVPIRFDKEEIKKKVLSQLSSEEFGKIELKNIIDYDKYKLLAQKANVDLQTDDTLIEVVSEIITFKIPAIEIFNKKFGEYVKDDESPEKLYKLIVGTCLITGKKSDQLSCLNISREKVKKMPKSIKFGKHIKLRIKDIKVEPIIKKN